MEKKEKKQAFIVAISYYDDDYNTSIDHYLVYGDNIAEATEQIYQLYNPNRCLKMEIVPISIDDGIIDLSKEVYEAIKGEYCD